jgi:hypothetical protein
MSDVLNTCLLFNGIGPECFLEFRASYQPLAKLQCVSLLRGQIDGCLKALNAVFELSIHNLERISLCEPRGVTAFVFALGNMGYCVVDAGPLLQSTIMKDVIPELSNKHRPKAFLLDIPIERYWYRKVFVVRVWIWRGEDWIIEVTGKDIVVCGPVSSKKMSQWRVGSSRVV